MTNLSKIRCIILIAMMIGLVPPSVYAGKILDTPPGQPDPSAKYLFYMHGRYIEREGPHADHKYGSILNVLAQKGLILIGEVRSNTDPRAYSTKIANQVKVLLNAGVPAKNITVAGFSRGGFMTLVSAARIRNNAIKFGILAGCGAEGSEFRRSYMGFTKRSAKNIRGRFFVAWDADDSKGRDCDLALQKARVKYRNLEFKTGDGHELFFKPNPVWIKPLAEFALSD